MWAEGGKGGRVVGGFKRGLGMLGRVLTDPSSLAGCDGVGGVDGSGEGVMVSTLGLVVPPS